MVAVHNLGDGSGVVDLEQGRLGLQLEAYGHRWFRVTFPGDRTTP